MPSAQDNPFPQCNKTPSSQNHVIGCFGPTDYSLLTPDAEPMCETVENIIDFGVKPNYYAEFFLALGSYYFGSVWTSEVVLIEIQDIHVNRYHS